MRRRTFFGLLGASAVGAALPIAGAPMSNSSMPGRGARTRAPREDAPSLDFLLAPLAGRPLPGGFRVASVSDVERGAAEVVLVRQDGARAIVHVFRRSLVSSGLATTRLLDLRWMNGGDGEHLTHEAAGLAVMHLASRIRRIETVALRVGLSPRQRASLASLLTHERRSAAHGGFRVASEIV